MVEFSKFSETHDARDQEEISPDIKKPTKDKAPSGWRPGANTISAFEGTPEKTDN